MRVKKDKLKRSHHNDNYDEKGACHAKKWQKGDPHVTTIHPYDTFRQFTNDFFFSDQLDHLSYTHKRSYFLYTAYHFFSSFLFCKVYHKEHERFAKKLNHISQLFLCILQYTGYVIFVSIIFDFISPAEVR